MRVYKRYLVFEWNYKNDKEDPSGGLDQVVKDFDTKDEALVYIETVETDFAEIFDREKGISLK